MNILKLKDGVKVPVNFDATRLVIRDNLEMLYVKLKPNEHIEPHTNSSDMIMYVISGSGEFGYNGQTHQIVKETVISVEKNVQREWKNIGHEELHLLVTKLL